MFVSVLARRLRPGKTYEDFVRAWYPDKGFDVEGSGPIIARNIADEQELIAIGYFDLPSVEAVGEALEGLSAQERVRHERIREVIEETSLRGIYEVVDEFDFTSDDSVERGRPGYVKREGGDSA